MKSVALRFAWGCCCLLALSACGEIEQTGTEQVRPGAAREALQLDVDASLQSANLTVFDDAVENGFQDGGWGTYSLKSTTYVHSGRYAAMLTPANWDGLQFSHTALAASGYTSLTFYVNGGTASGQTIWAGVTDTKGNHYYTAIDNYLPSKRIRAGQWQQMTLPLSAINAGSIQIASIYIMTGVANSQPAVYVDDVVLVASGGGTTTGTTGTTTGTTGTTTGTTGTTGTTTGTTTGRTTTTTGGTTGTTTGSTTGSGTTTTGGTTGTTTAGSTTGGAGTGAATGGTTGSTTSGNTASGRESWAWVYANWSTSLSTIVANASSFTHISPTFYSLNYNYSSGVAYYATCSTSSGTYNCTNAGTNSFGGLTTAAYTKQLAAAGLATVPAIYAGSANGGSDTGVQNILNSSTVAASFISAMVTEAVNNGYAGYNLDWEMGSAVGSAYASKFVTFVNQFKAALAPHGMSLSVDAIVSNINGTWCSSNNGYLDFSLLATSSIDRVIIEDYTASLGTVYNSCQAVTLSASSPASCPVNSAGSDVTATGLFNFMCHNLPAGMVVIGLESYSSATNPIAGQAVSIMEQYGMSKIAVWPQIEGSYPFLSSQGLVASQSDWYSLLKAFLAY